MDPGPGVGNFISQADVAPFNQYIGSDFDFDDFGVDFSATWTFVFAPFAGGTVINSASLLLALFDHDSQATGSQVGLFTVNGVDLTAELSALLEGAGGGNFQYNIYTLVLPGSVFPSLLLGSAAVSLDLLGPGLVQPFGFSEVFEVEANGGGVDYSRLTIDFTPPPDVVIPEPTSVALMAGGLLGLIIAGGRVRRRRNI